MKNIQCSAERQKTVFALYLNGIWGNIYGGAMNHSKNAALPTHKYYTQHFWDRPEKMSAGYILLSWQGFPASN
jgi:hypothetical protein